MNPWTIYCILQADTVSMTCSIIALFAGIITAIAFVGKIIIGPEVNSYDNPSQNDLAYFNGWKLCLKTSVPILLISSSIATFVPSSKTMAAMIILPAIVENKELEKEPSELYSLAKQALVDLAPKVQ